MAVLLFCDVIASTRSDPTAANRHLVSEWVDFFNNDQPHEYLTT